MSGNDWTPAMVADLTQRWNIEGESSLTIAKALGISKSAVVGKARRLNLSSRPSPIRRAAPAATNQTTIPKTASTAVARLKKEPSPAPQLPQPLRQPRMPAEGCRWPMWGHQEPPTHRYCGAPRDSAALSYCPHHLAIAFPPANRREAA